MPPIIRNRGEVSAETAPSTSPDDGPAVKHRDWLRACEPSCWNHARPSGGRGGRGMYFRACPKSKKNSGSIIGTRNTQRATNNQVRPITSPPMQRKRSKTDMAGHAEKRGGRACAPRRARSRVTRAGRNDLRQFATMFVLLLAFALKGLIPHGYMPGESGLVLCPGGGPMSVVAAKARAMPGHTQKFAHTQAPAEHSHTGYVDTTHGHTTHSNTAHGLAAVHAPAVQPDPGVNHQDHHAPGTTVEAHSPCVFASADAGASDSALALTRLRVAEHIFINRALGADFFSTTRPPLPARGPPHPRRLSQSLNYIA